MVFCMLSQYRLGQKSMWSALDAGLLRMVLDYPTHDARKTINVEDDTSQDDEIYSESDQDGGEDSEADQAQEEEE
jgi:hypothetical protein